MNALRYLSLYLFIVIVLIVCMVIEAIAASV